MKKILLIDIADIGDIVSGSIVFDSLRAQGHEITYLMPKFVHSLWDSTPNVKLVGPDATFTEKFDLIVDLTSDGRSRKIVRRIKAKEKIGRVKSTWQRVRHWTTYTKMVPKKLDGHIVGDFYAILDALNDHEKRLPHLEAKAEWPAKFGFTPDDKVVSIHFGAENPKRRISEHILSYTIQALHKMDYKIVLLGTETEIAEDLIKKNNNIPIFHKTTLGEVKQVLLCSKLFIGACSGILHTAGALDVNSIGVYGPTLTRVSGPRSKMVSFFQQDLDCRPCNQNIDCPIGEICMKTMDEKKFFEFVLSKLK